MEIKIRNYCPAEKHLSYQLNWQGKNTAALSNTRMNEHVSYKVQHTLTKK